MQQKFTIQNRKMKHLVHLMTTIGFTPQDLVFNLDDQLSSRQKKQLKNGRDSASDMVHSMRGTAEEDIRPFGEVMSKQQNIVQQDFGYALWIPESTPNGRKVTIQMGEHSGAQVMHAQSPDQSELYFEVTTYPMILDHDILMKKQQNFLSKHADDGSLSQITQTTIDRSHSHSI